MKYIVTKEIKSETQVIWIFYLQDFMFFVIWGGLTFIFRSQVHSSLQIVYMLFSLFIGIAMMIRSPGNPKRRFYQSVALYILRPKYIYRYYKEHKEDEKGGDQAYKRRNTYHRV